MPIFKREFVFSGDTVYLYDFPEQTRILYPNPPLRPVSDSRAAVISALDNPLGAPPLISQVDSTTHVTIAFDDPCTPVPLVRDDPRRLIIESVVEKLYAAGVKREHIRLVCAGGLHRKWTLKELKYILGKKIVKEFSDRIVCHDAEDPAQIVSLGRTSKNEVVEINRAAVDTDLCIYVNVNFLSMNGGWKTLAVGLGTYQSIRHHHRPDVLNIGSRLEPTQSGMHESIARMGEVIQKHVNLFTVESVLNNDLWPPLLARHMAPAGLDKNRKPKVTARMALPVASHLPAFARRRVRESIRANYRLIGVHAGDVDRVHVKTLELISRQNTIPVQGQSDIVIYGVPNFCPYSALSTINPILVLTMGMGYYFNFHRIRPLVKQGGVVIMANPFAEQFHPVHHPSYEDFYYKHLPDLSDPNDIINNLEESFASNQGYKDRYRFQHAYHGVHALLAWYWAAKGMEHTGTVIAADVDDAETAKRMGLETAANLDTAIEKAREIMGKDASITYHFLTPLSVADVNFV
ncbi:MAG: DUF2088 domain-containing protein [Deltaproteobacteria bacterium]|nr:DUF2088 domain-containing protein [Candidatus Zymogenaceae bacterium]